MRGCHGFVVLSNVLPNVLSSMLSIGHVVKHVGVRRHITSCHVTSYHVTSRHVTSCHVTSCHITSRHVTSCHITSHHVTSHHVTSHHVTSHHITSHHVTSLTHIHEIRGSGTSLLQFRRGDGLFQQQLGEVGGVVSYSERAVGLLCDVPTDVQFGSQTNDAVCGRREEEGRGGRRGRRIDRSRGCVRVENEK